VLIYFVFKDTVLSTVCETTWFTLAARIL